MVVDPLATAGADAPAVDLFLRLAALSAGLSPTWDAARDAPAIREICSRLGGFPLALELAAAQMDVLGPADLLDFMREAGLGVLATTTTDDLRRFSTMDAAIGWSVDRLAPEDQRLLRLLAVFPDGFVAPAAADLLSAVYPDTPGATAQVAASLGRLTRAHLVQSRQRSTASGGMTSHFHMLEPIRLFALDRLRAEGGLAAARRAHAVTVADRIAALDRQIRDNRMGLVEEVEREYPDGRAALDWALESGDADLASRLISALKYVHSFRYRAAGLLAQFDRLLERSPALTAHARLWAHYERAELASRERDLPRLREALLAALADAEAVDDPLLGAMALLFWSCDLDEDPRDALATIERARVLLGEDGDTVDPSFLQSWLRIRQGVELHRLGRLEEARAALEAGVARKRAEDHEIGNGPPLAHLGRLQMDLGLPRQAADTLLHALDLADTLSDGWLRFHAARWLAEVARRGGPEAQAIADLLDAAVAAEFAAHAYVLGPGESLPEAPHIEQPALPLPEAIRLAGNLPSLLPEQDDPVPNARYTGQRLE